MSLLDMNKNKNEIVIGEKNKYKWTDNATKKPCYMIRNFSGAWCGYVGVKSNNPLYNNPDDSRIYNLDVHGGVTYTDFNDWHRENLWWIGFDCSHFQDLSPKMPQMGGVYRDVKYVKHQCAELAQQLKELED